VPARGRAQILPVDRRALVTAIMALVLLFASPGPARAAAQPDVLAAWSLGVVATSARLRAEIDPEGARTTYHFDYITAAAYAANLAAYPPREGFAGASRAPAGSDALVGEGSAPVVVSQSINGLGTATAYLYRVLATNTLGTEAGATHSLTTQALPTGGPLADGRGWEMVSPTDKSGGQIQGPGEIHGGGVVEAAAGGGALTYSSTASFGEGAAGAPYASQYISRRGAAGWSTQNITAPTLSGSYGEAPNGVPYQLFSPDLARAVMLDGDRCGAGEPCPRAYSLMEPPGAASPTSPAEPDLALAGAGPDLTHVVLSACAALAADATEIPAGEGCDQSEPNLYEWSGGAVEALNLLPGETHTTPGAFLAAQSGAISADGRRVYFTLGEDDALYLREAGSATRLLPETAGGGAAFQTASADGSTAFFTKGGTLYRYEVGAEASDPIATGVTGVLGASADGSAVYYQTTQGLFLWRSPGTTTEVASGSEAAQESDWPPTTGTARVSADGSELLFLSQQPLTGYDNTDQTTGRPDSEVFLWSAGSGAGGTPACLSCNPTNERPLGPSTIPGAYSNGSPALAVAGEIVTDSYKPRVLSANGERVFFESSDALVIQDSDKAADVYEWEAPGEGSCAAPGGCLSLVSGGRGAAGASFLDASADGSDAFFLTKDSLVGADPGSTDVYDARVGGGFPEPQGPIPCLGDACQSLPSEPEDPEPGTLREGTGNPPPMVEGPGRRPRACPKSKRRVSRHGKARCVKKGLHAHHHKKRTQR
jgi:hypothetical protein